ncbi:hypothetical protein JCM10914A_33350 [Paenibacillus sp. JCM 10914]|uniref:DUF4321 domain-containing protein n=1 Tax=Paenibacillus sp. JCM 10914 TaxID=1236974 RepID=UPI0003CCB32A|nr:DUF4321 domain-containing protein [Paenibacillus sp. JCM 10914]GAE07610.1 hypothetical protein JCM10914_3848 [Paenibacillus sp. JCM 10914]
MKKSKGMLILFLLLGWLLGTWLAKALEPIKALSFLTAQAPIRWSPRADFDIISYDINLELKVCLLGLLGIVAAIWLYRRF